MAVVPAPERRRHSGDAGGGAVDPVAQYLDEIGAAPLLSAERERELAATIAAGRRAAAELADRRPGGVDADLLRHRVAEGEAAFDEFVRANLRLVVSAAKRYQGTGVPLLDLVQDGNLGLIRAVEKFDHTKGFRFSTYAMWWIRQFISRGLAATRTTIRLPTRANDDLVRLRGAVRDRSDATGWRDAAERASLDAGRAAELWPLLADPVSLSTEVGDGDAELGDFVEDPEALVAVEYVADHLRSVDLDRLLEPLDERERTIVVMRHGFDGGDGASTVDIGRHLGLSRERVRQLELRAHAKLTHPSRPSIRRFVDGW